MDPKNLKYQMEALRLQQKAEDLVIKFIDRFLPNGTIYDSIENCEFWLYEIYPELFEGKTDEEILKISSFIAGIVFIMINTPGTGIRWISCLRDLEDNEDDIEDNYEDYFEENDGENEAENNIDAEENDICNDDKK